MRRHLLLIATLLSLIWLLLSDAEPSGLAFGAVFVALGCWLCARIQPNPLGRINLWQLVRFIPYFLYESLRGGIDVSRLVLTGAKVRACSRVAYPMRLMRHDARIFFVNCINLMPGTLTLGWHGDQVQIHLLDSSRTPLQGLGQLEERVALLFKSPLRSAEQDTDAGSRR